jgi:lysophospholipase L1-like esterase
LGESNQFLFSLGYNSRWGVKLIEELMPYAHWEANNPWKDLALAIVFFGANDAVLAGDKAHVPLAEYSASLAAIVGRIRSAAGPQVAIILVTPPCVDAEQWPTRSVQAASQYAAAVRAAAAALHTHVLDLWADTEYKMELSDFRDGLHFGESGNFKMGSGIKNIIRNELPHLCPEDGCPMEMHYPPHFVLGDALYLPEESDESNHYAEIISSWEWKK